MKTMLQLFALAVLALCGCTERKYGPELAEPAEIYDTCFPSGPLTVEDAREHEHLGVKFVTHHVLTPLNRFQQIRASEWRTGYGIPGTFAETHEEAAKLARLEAETRGRDAFEKVLGPLPTLNHIAEDQMGRIA